MSGVSPVLWACPCILHVPFGPLEGEPLLPPLLLVPLLPPLLDVPPPSDAGSPDELDVEPLLEVDDPRGGPPDEGSSLHAKSRTESESAIDLPRTRKG